MMNIQTIALGIQRLNIHKDLKIKKLNDLILDCRNEMDAQEENMRPEIADDLAEGLRISKNIMRDVANS